MDANVAALTCPQDAVGKAYNIGGGNNEVLARVFEMLRDITGMDPRLSYIEKQKGDVMHTFADISLAQKHLGFQPRTRLFQGLEREVAWLRTIL